MQIKLHAICVCAPANEEECRSNSCVKPYKGPHEMERKYLTLRTEIKKLTRKTIYFSKDEMMHDTVLNLFINRKKFTLQV